MSEAPQSPDLRALAESFARAFPAIADRLAGDGADPDVTRLVEGFAFLAARIERVLDTTSARAASHFAELIAPEVLRGFPSATLLEVAPRPSRAPSRIEVPSGAEVDSIEVDGTRCRFRVNAPFAIVPFRVEEVRATSLSSRGHTLVVTLVPSVIRGVGAKLPPLAALFPLRLHIAGEPNAASALLLWLHRHLDEVELVVGGESCLLGAASLRAWGLSRAEALLPEEPLEHPGIRLLREVMILPQKLAFVEIDPSVIPPWTSPSTREPERVALHFRFDEKLPAGVNVTRDLVRVNCVAAVNAFEASAEPFRPSLERPSEVLRAAGLAPNHGGIYAVRAVTARLRDGRTAQVPRMEDFDGGPMAHLPNLLPDAFYTVRHAASASLGESLELSLGAPVDAKNLPDVDVVSTDLWATNGAHTAALGIGDVRVAAHSMPPNVDVRNIVAVTAYRAPPDGDDRMWRTVATCALSARSLADRDALRALWHVLNLHAWAGAAGGASGSAQAARAHAQRMAAILDVRATKVGALLGGARVRGHDVAVRLSDKGFDGDGDAFLFGSVLARLFAHEASVNAFVRTTITMAETGITFEFGALHGDRALG